MGNGPMMTLGSVSNAEEEGAVVEEVDKAGVVLEMDEVTMLVELVLLVMSVLDDDGTAVELVKPVLVVTRMSVGVAGGDDVAMVDGDEASLELVLALSCVLAELPMLPVELGREGPGAELVLESKPELAGLV